MRSSRFLLVPLTMAIGSACGGSGGETGQGGAAAESTTSSSSSEVASSSSTTIASVAASSSTGTFCKPGDGMSCYDGPPGTMGKGVCAPGSATCAADGSAYGPCMGETLPTPENCASGTDDDCDGQACPATYGFLTGVTGDVRPIKIAADGAGGVVVAGYFQGSVDFGDGPIQSITFQDLFIADWNGSGTLAWVNTYAASVTAVVATDPMGNVWVAADATGDVDFGGGSFTGATHLVELDAQGTYVSEIPVGPVYVADLAFDPNDGSIVFAMEGNAPFMLQGQSFSPMNGATDAAIVKLDAMGNLLWMDEAHASGAGGSILPLGLAIPSDGSISAVGSFRGDADFGLGNVVSSGGPKLGLDGFLLHVETDGKLAFAKAIAGPGDDKAMSILIRKNGDAIVAGQFDGTLDLGKGVMTASSADTLSDLYVATFDSMGTALTSIDRGEAANMKAGFGAWSVLATKSGYAFEGYNGTTVDFGTGKLLPGDIVAAFDDTDELRFTDSLPSFSVATTTSDGKIAVAGSYSKSLTLGGKNIMGSGMFITEIDY